MILSRGKTIEGRIVRSLPTPKNPLGILYYVIRKQGVWVFLMKVHKDKKDKTFVENKMEVDFNRTFELEHPEETSKKEQNFHEEHLIYD